MTHTSMDSIIRELRSEQVRLQGQLHRVTAAIAALGKAGLGPSKSKSVPAARTRIISAAGRKRIAAAQRARWAKVRAAKRG
jgi:hypothetical protein